MSFRTCTIVVLSCAVFAGGALGTSNGMVLCIDSNGHLALEPPHLKHARHHADGADHEPHDFGGDVDHGDLHAAMGDCSDSLLAFQKAERSHPGAIARLIAKFDFALPLYVSPAVEPLPEGHDGGHSGFRGGTARVELTCLRSVVLLV